MKRRKEQPISLHRIQPVFSDGISEITVSVNTNISEYEYVNDLLTVHTVVNKNGRRYNTVRPLYSPSFTFDSKKTKRERDILRRCKAEWKASNKYRRLESVKVS